MLHSQGTCNNLFRAHFIHVNGRILPHPGRILSHPKAEFELSPKAEALNLAANFVQIFDNTKVY
jgi:hypothetical protein